MFAEWVTTGVSWGIMIASAMFTLFVIAGFIVGMLSMLVYFVKGDQDEDEKRDRDDYPHRPA